MVDLSFLSTKTFKGIFSDKGRSWLDYKYYWYRLQFIYSAKYHKVTSFPTHIDIESTNNCNFRCVMCPINEYKGDWGFIKWDLFTKIVDEGATKGLKSIKFNWRGEPLLHPKIVEMVKYAKDKGIIEVMFNTNAQLLKPELAEKLIDAGLDRIIFSVDGSTKENYEKVRRGGKYEIVEENIQHLAKLRNEKGLKKPYTRIQMVEMKENLPDVPRFIEKWTNVIDQVCVNPWINVQMKENVNRSTGRQIIVKGRKPCGQLWQRLTIAYDGTVMMCCGDWFKKTIVGHLDKQNLSEIWNSDYLNKVRDQHKKNQIDQVAACKDCTVLDSYELELK